MEFNISQEVVCLHQYEDKEDPNKDEIYLIENIRTCKCGDIGLELVGFGESGFHLWECSECSFEFFGQAKRGYTHLNFAPLLHSKKKLKSNIEIIAPISETPDTIKRALEEIEKEHAIQDQFILEFLDRARRIAENEDRKDNRKPKE